MLRDMIPKVPENDEKKKVSKACFHERENESKQS